MGLLDIFHSDRFSVEALTVAIQEQPFVPGRLGELGLFSEEGVTSTVVEIESEGNILSLVKNADRGAPGQVVLADKRKLIPLKVSHLPERALIVADEIQGVREFGSQSQLQTIESIVFKRLEKMRSNLDATHEWQRVGAIRGKILDADPGTVLLDIYQAFGVTQTSISFQLSNEGTLVRAKCASVKRAIEDALGAARFSGMRAFCGREFWDKWIEHKGVKETYLNSEAAASLRGDPTDSFSFGGIIWEQYSGIVGGQAYVPNNEAYVVPEGVPDLFISRFAPANYIETVNTIGLPYYAKQNVLDFDKGIELEAQSNPIHLCTRPKSVIQLTM